MNKFETFFQFRMTINDEVKRLGIKEGKAFRPPMQYKRIANMQLSPETLSSFLIIQRNLYSFPARDSSHDRFRQFLSR